MDFTSYGLVGLLATFGILNREKELHIYGPKGIKEVTLLQLKISQSHAKYKMTFHELSSKKSELIFEDDKVTVRTIPLDHRVYTNGYLFTEKENAKKLHMDNIRNYKEIDKADYLNIKAGKDIVLSMVQSLSMKEYPEGTFDSFGLAIFDECHHLGAEKFLNIKNTLK